MDVNAIGPVASPAVRFSATEHASKLAEANAAARIEKPAAVAGDNVTAAPNLVHSQTYSPALYAQAAHFQLLAQAGAFAALHQPTDSASSNSTPAVAKVGNVEGGTVKTLK